jgi:hypothetical protein
MEYSWQTKKEEWLINNKFNRSRFNLLPSCGVVVFFYHRGTFGTKENYNNTIITGTHNGEGIQR